MKHLASAARTAAWLVVAMIVLSLVSAPGGPLGPRLARAQAALVLTGDVEDLALGQPSVLRITVTNDAVTPVTVRSVTATASGGDHACDASSLQVTPWEGLVEVPGHGSTEVELTLVVADRPACAGRTWQLEYAAS